MTGWWLVSLIRDERLTLIWYQLQCLSPRSLSGGDVCVILPSLPSQLDTGLPVPRQHANQGTKRWTGNLCQFYLQIEIFHWALLTVKNPKPTQQTFISPVITEPNHSTSPFIQFFFICLAWSQDLVVVMGVRTRVSRVSISLPTNQSINQKAGKFV